MNKQEIILFIEKNTPGELKFRDPVLIQLSPHDIGLKAYGLQIVNGELVINQDGGTVEWNYASEPVRNSIIQRLKLIYEETINAISN
jgi:hypothetical protein